MDNASRPNARDADGSAIAKVAAAEPGTPFSLSELLGLPVPVLIAVPHAGRDYAPELLAAMRNPAWGPTRLEDRYVDTLGIAVAEATGASLVVAHAPRAMIDLNRAPDDVDWSMIVGSSRRTTQSSINRRARSGLGLVPRRLGGAGEVWKQRLPLAELDERIAIIHRPYHAAVSAALERLRDKWGAALLIDLHSMPPLTPAGGRAGSGAEFVIGDRFGASCVPELTAHALRYLSASGRRVAHNRPYSGGYALDRHAATRRSIHAIQIEVCRSIYLDAHLDQPGPRLPAVIRTLTGLVRILANEVAAIGTPGSFRQAAE